MLESERQEWATLWESWPYVNRHSSLEKAKGRVAMKFPSLLSYWDSHLAQTRHLRSPCNIFYACWPPENRKQNTKEKKKIQLGTHYFLILQVSQSIIFKHTFLSFSRQPYEWTANNALKSSSAFFATCFSNCLIFNIHCIYFFNILWRLV